MKLIMRLGIQKLRSEIYNELSHCVEVCSMDTPRPGVDLVAHLIHFAVIMLGKGM